ncbi:GNAT family N-acetyltransferase [Streptomyces sp. NBC_01803]|uniref:GNAT family N-acetyltransferase n=1 Tax=Streptomyces sp. NBC_01803 TaxID=2975946 RepID=UPI002DDA74F5|nr:GNAT family N-acetyltransferase [Streptomyces sp. NBC_01803]WSA46088.1 GNAT family N-acetyltransferase [Streptomyces sp. NBC_01803]
MPGDVPLSVPGAEGLYRRHRPDPESFDASWNAADVHRLHAHLTGPDRPAALDRLLTAWERAMPRWPRGADAEAVLTRPSRDVALTPVLLAHGMIPKRIAAVRPAAHRAPRPGPCPRALIRPLETPDAEWAARLWLDGLRWDAQFGSCAIRASSARNIGQRLATTLVWVAEIRREVVGLLAVDDPARETRLLGGMGYLTSLMVAAPHRGEGIGTALAHTAHTALAEAGCTRTMLHYAALSPVSAPFWHHHGYRPLWTTWARRAPPR